jgi:hypothetical protein
MLYCNGLSIRHHGDSFVSVSFKFQKRSVSFFGSRFVTVLMTSRYAPFSLADSRLFLNFEIQLRLLHVVLRHDDGLCCVSRQSVT